MIKRINPLGRYNDSKCVCPDEHTLKIREAKANKAEKGNRQITVILGDINTVLSETNRITSQKINMDVEDLNTTINQQSVTDIHRILYPTTAENNFFQVPIVCS